ncbi:MAG: helix-hairpin-helix domain-containing protein [Eubacterium sp.]|nr:helix-hairpin-helix domain-containing protein [Eubacterium sp.]
MKTEKNQTLLFIGIALAVVGVILIVYAIALPRVYVTETVTVPETSVAVSVADSATAAATTALSVSYPLDLNTATAEELATIEGVGESRANAIIEYRNYLGGYSSTEQIMEIKGFSETLYDQIAPYITVA